VAQAKIGLNLTAHEVQQGKLVEAAKALMEAEFVAKTAIQFTGNMAALGAQERAAELILDTLAKIKK
jgi:hypothetical protein